MATKRIQTTEIVDAEPSHPPEVAELKKEIGQNWEHFESVIDKFLGREFSLQFPANFMDMENSAKTVPLDYVYQRANAHGQTISAYLKSYMETAGHHAVDLRIKGRYFARLPYRLDVIRAYSPPHSAGAGINQTSQTSVGAVAPAFDFQGIAALLTALKPEPAQDNTPLLLEMIRSTETRAREDLKSMLGAFKSEMQQLKDSSLTANDVIDNMRELKELQKEFTSAPVSVQNRFQKLGKSDPQPTNWVELAKYAVDRVAPNLAAGAVPRAQPSNAKPPAAAISENLTPEDLIEIKRDDIIRALQSDLWQVDQLIDELAELIMVAKKYNNLHLIPELFDNAYDIYAALDALLENCGSQEYQQQISQAVKAHPHYQLLKVINLNGHSETSDINGTSTDQKIRFA